MSDDDTDLGMACIAVSVAMGQTVDDLVEAGVRSSAIGAAVLWEAALVTARFMTAYSAEPITQNRIDAICGLFRQGLEEAIDQHAQTMH